MDQKAKALWTARLRSGEDEQGNGVLCDREGKKCCLGVLSDVLGVPKVFRLYNDRPTEEGGDPSRLGRWEYNFGGHWESTTGIPNGYQGIDAVAREHLIKMNDDDREPFAVIADWIDENL